MPNVLSIAYLIGAYKIVLNSIHFCIQKLTDCADG